MIFAVYRKSNGRLLRWVVDGDPKMHPLAGHEAMIEIPPEDYAKMHPQAFVSRETGLDPKDDDKFVELDERGDVKRVFYDEPDRQLGPREKRIATHRADEEAKRPEPLPNRREPYTA